MKPINHIPSPSSPPFTVPPPIFTHPLGTYFTALSFIINPFNIVKGVNNVKRGFSMYSHSEYV
jgi:hypothetical protein